MPARRPRSKRWKRDGRTGAIDLAEVVRQVRPTMLIGASTAAALLPKPLSGNGQALRAAHHFSTFQSRAHGGSHASRSDCLDRRPGAHRHRQSVPARNLPGSDLCHRPGEQRDVISRLCLGAIVSRSSRISDNMFAAAANAVSSLVACACPAPRCCRMSTTCGSCP